VKQTVGALQRCCERAWLL